MASTMRFDKWENTLGQPYGTVLQVKQATTNSNFTTSSTSFVNVTGLSISITPKDTNSKFLLTYTGAGGHSGNNLNFYTFLRSGTNVSLSGAVQGFIFDSGNNASQSAMPVSMSYLDSPATAGAITYTVAVRTDANTMYLGNRPGGSQNTDLTLIVKEIAG